MADGSSYFDAARTVRKLGRSPHDPSPVFAVGVGCELAHARDMVYADSDPQDSDEAAVAVGVSC